MTSTAQPGVPTSHLAPGVPEGAWLGVEEAWGLVAVPGWWPWRRRGGVGVPCSGLYLPLLRRMTLGTSLPWASVSLTALRGVLEHLQAPYLKGCFWEM